MRNPSWLITPLFALSLIGVLTLNIMPGRTGLLGLWSAWTPYLVLAPLALSGLVWMGWNWTAMACVMYGTIGVALDLSTIAGILGGQENTDGLLALSGASGLCNFLVILAGGYSFVRALQEPSPPESPPPSPRSPSSSASS